MKKTNLLVLSVAAALLATSCSKDQVSEVNPGEAIRFSALTGSATKAAPTTSENLTQYKVYGRFTQSTSLDFDETYTLMGDSWNSASNKPHYWPASGTEEVHFFAHSPVDLATALGTTIGSPATTGWTISNVTLPDDASQQQDVVYGRTITTKSATTGAVSLVLKHVFAQIELKALCNNDSMRVTVYGAKIYGLKDGTTLTFPSASTTASGEPSNIWGSVANVRTYYVGDRTADALTADSVVLNNVATSIMRSNNFMVIPQQLAAWDSENDKPNASDGGYIGILCKMEKKKPSGEYDVLFPTAYTAVPLGNNFQKNKKYVITLKFFDGNGGGGITPPDGGDGGGEPVLAPITFTVSVTPWESSENNIDKPLSRN